MIGSYSSHATAIQEILDTDNTHISLYESELVKCEKSEGVFSFIAEGHKGLSNYTHTQSPLSGMAK